MKYVVMILSAITAFVIGAGGAITAVIGSGYDMNNKSWTIAIVVGAMSASKDWRSQMRMPPISPNDTEFAVKPTPPAP
jgi:hypothetical protein